MRLPRITRLVWDERNIQHIAFHQVTPQEVEEACFGRQTLVFRRGERHVVLGRTGTGRYLFVVLERAGRYRGRVVTAREVDKRERRLYRKRVR